MNASHTQSATKSNRSFTTFGIALIVAALVVGWWLATSVGDIVTALWMVLFVAVGIIFISLGRHPDADS